MHRHADSNIFAQPKVTEKCAFSKNVGFNYKEYLKL